MHTTKATVIAACESKTSHKTYVMSIKKFAPGDEHHLLTKGYEQATVTRV